MARATSSEAPRNVWGWGTSFDSEEERSFLAQRVALYARQVGVFFALLYLVGVAVVAVVMPAQLLAVHLHPAKIANAVIAALAFGVWWAVRRPGRSRAALVAGDALLPLLVNLCGVLAAPFIPPAFALTF